MASRVLNRLAGNCLTRIAIGCTTVLTLLMLIAPVTVAHFSLAGEEENSERQKSEVAAEAKEFVPRCIFAAGEGDAVKLELHPDPILRWSNPTVGDVHGEVYVWTDRGQPHIVASYFRFFSPNWGTQLEITSCTEKAASATVGGVHFWRTSQPGMTRKVLDGVDEPAKNDKTRLIQMRRMANDFVVRLDDTRTKGTGVKRELRLLNQPVFRYPAPVEKSEYIDGALFAFVEGTDPETLLVFEAVVSSGKEAWRFGLARMNRDALQARFRDVEVWTAPYIENVTDRPKEPFAVFPLRQRLQDVDGIAPKKEGAKPRSN